MGSRFIHLLCVMTIMLASAADVFAQTRPTTAPAAVSPEPRKAAVVVLKGEIDDYTRDALFKHFKEARAEGANVIILYEDTPGGLVTAGLEISQFIKQQTDLHTIAYIHKAYSAGALIAMACNEIAMEPSAAIGDCAPIMLSPEGSLQPMPDTERAKMVSPVLADFRDSAARNGYSPLLVQAMVTIGHSIHYVQAPDGTQKFVDQADYDKLISNGYKSVAGVPDPLESDKELLTIHTDIAKKIGVCKTVADSPDDLAKAMNLQIVDTFERGPGDMVIELLNGAGCRVILIGLFFLFVKIAFSAPGHGAAEAGVIVTLGLLVGVPMLTGYAQWWEILVIFAGLALVAFEIFVFPGHMISGIAGALMVLGGLVMTFVPAEPHGLPGVMPSFNGTYWAIEKGLIVVVCGMVCSLVLWFWLQRYLPKLPYFNRLVISATTGGSGESGVAVHPTGWPKIGDVGKAVTDLRPGGKAAFFDEALGDARVTQVVSESGFTAAETQVVVREVAGNRVVVRTMV